MAIVLETFRGLLPKVAPHLLAEHNAQQALNTRLTNGSLRAWRKPGAVAELDAAIDASSLYRYVHPNGDVSWLTFAEAGVDIVRSPLAADATERIYFTGAGTGELRVTESALVDNASGAPYPNAWYKAGVPAPTTAPTATLTGSGSGTVWDRAYAYTHVNAWGEESAPSPVGDLVAWQAGHSVELTTLDQTPAAGYAPITKWRIYRANTGFQATVYQFVAEVTVNASSPQYTDAVAAVDLAEALQTEGWSLPDADMRGVVALPNGILAGFNGQEIFFSEPYAPYTFPSQYALTVDYTIIGLGVAGTTLVVMTNAYPILIAGSHPSYMSQEKLADRQPCVSKRGITSISGGVLYPTPTGLFMIGPGVRRVVTSGLYTREEWQALNPDTLFIAVHDETVFAFNSDGVTEGLAFSMREGQPDLARVSYLPDAVYSEPSGDRLYMTYLSTNGAVRLIEEFAAGGTREVYLWRSKQYRTRNRSTMTAARVRADYVGANVTAEELAAYQAELDAIEAANVGILALGEALAPLNGQALNTFEVNGDALERMPADSGVGGVTFRYYGDGVLIHTCKIYDNKPFRLPSGFRAMEFEFELEGDIDVEELRVGSSVSDVVRAQ